MRHVPIKNKLTTIMSCLLISIVWAGGCQQPSHVHKQHVGPAGVEYARINIETQDLQQGMERMFFQIQSRLGPVDSEVIIRDHLESIRRDLYHTVSAESEIYI